VPPDSVWCTRELHAELLTFGKIQRRSSIIHRIVRCTTGQCPVLQRIAALNSPASGIRSAIIHRTYPVYTGLSGEPTEQRLLHANGHLQQQLMRARARRSQARAMWHTGHSTVHVWCATGHPGGPSSQRSNGWNPTAWCHTRISGHQDPGANIITRCDGTKSHTYDESWHRIECHIFTI
jgi:hypothetical protein